MTDSTLYVPARDIPVPASVSPEAQAVLAMGPLGPAPEWPAPDDVEGWKAIVALGDQGTLAMADADGPMSALWSGDAATQLEERDLGAFPVYVVTAEGVEDGDERVYLDIHGGAWLFGGGEVCRMTARAAARRFGARVWSVDYRMPPEHPFPAALDDCFTAYRQLLEERRAEQIVVGGGSAGANLAAALIVRARDEDLPLPAGVVLETGAFDLTAAGDSFRTNMGLDTVLTGDFSPAMALHAGGEDRRHPYISPLFADLTGFPPAILATGTRDLLLSDNVRMHRALRAAGCAAELHVWEAASHGGFLGAAPEDQDRSAELRRFAEEHWARGNGVTSADRSHDRRKP
jgi:monoterpene epsilon-lactone hydrolase